MTRIIFVGEELADFGPPRPGSHMKLMFVPEGETWSPSDTEAPRPPSRTYTPRLYDPDRRELEVEFVHHGDGIAATWAETAKKGDPMFLAGPGGGYDVPEDATHLVLVADDTALPAAATVLEALPATCEAIVFGDIYGAEEERDLSPTAAVSPIWLHRAPTDARPGSLLEAAIKEMNLPSESCYFWVACEAATMRRIRDHLVDERGMDRERVHTRGYWKLGESNYPDHDYGKD
jgi:NADPH-dependent ferric siderophore reductase